MLKLGNDSDKLLALAGQIETMKGRDAARARVRVLSSTLGLLKDAEGKTRDDMGTALRRARRRGASLGELAKDAGLSRARIAQLTAGAYWEEQE